MNIKQGLFRPFIKKIVSTYFSSIKNIQESDVIIQFYVYLTKLSWNWGKFFSSVQVLNNIWHKFPELAQYLAICQYRPCLLTKCKWRVTLSTLNFHIKFGAALGSNEILCAKKLLFWDMEISINLRCICCVC